MGVLELINSHPGTIFYYLWKTNPKRRGSDYLSMSQVGARVNRYKQINVEVDEP